MLLLVTLVAYLTKTILGLEMSNLGYILIPTVFLSGTAAVWITRILTRLYLSEHHLAIDAEFRSTMAETFLALIEEGAIENKQMEQVLAALFRPASDGLVKDDAAPSFSPGDLLSR